MSDERPIGLCPYCESGLLPSDIESREWFGTVMSPDGKTSYIIKETEIPKSPREKTWATQVFTCKKCRKIIGFARGVR